METKGIVLGNGKIARKGSLVWASHVQLCKGRKNFSGDDYNINNFPMVRLENAGEVLRTVPKTAIGAVRILGFMSPKGMINMPGRIACVINFDTFEIKIVTIEANDDLKAAGYNRMPLIVESAEAAKAAIWPEELRTEFNPIPQGEDIPF